MFDKSINDFFNPSTLRNIIRGADTRRWGASSATSCRWPLLSAKAFQPRRFSTNYCALVWWTELPISWSGVCPAAASPAAAATEGGDPSGSTKGATSNRLAAAISYEALGIINLAQFAYLRRRMINLSCERKMAHVGILFMIYSQELVN